MKKKFVCSVKKIFVAFILSSILVGCSSTSDSIMSESAYTEDFETSEVMSNESLDSYDSYGLSNKMLSSADMDYEAGTSDSGDDSENLEYTDDTTRKLISTFNIYGESSDFDACITNIENKTENLGGYVESSSIYVSGGYFVGDDYKDLRYADYTLRIPEEKVDEFCEDINDNINVTSSSKSVEDVTLTYTDLTSKKSALKSEQEALEKLMDSAETMEDIIAINDKLTEVRYELESLESQLRVYDNKIDYSTVYLTIEEKSPDDLTIITEETFFDKVKTGFKENLKNIKDFFLNIVMNIIIYIPQILLIVIIVIILLVLIKRKKNKLSTNNKTNSYSIHNEKNDGNKQDNTDINRKKDENNNFS